MSDKLHNHLSRGHRQGCPACAQLVEDMERMRDRNLTTNAR